jgi:uroporphyrinogen decarboxylase
MKRSEVSMTGRERFWKAFQGKQPDKVPITEGPISENVVRELARLLKIETESSEPYLELSAKVIEKLDLDAVLCGHSFGNRPISDTQLKDRYGRILNISPHGEALPARPTLTTLEEAEQYEMASLLVPEDFDEIRFFMERFGDSKDYCIVLSDPYKEAWRTLGGLENLLVAFYEDPPLAERLIRVSTDFLLRAVDLAVEIGVRAFIVNGDYAMETGLLFSPEIYRRFLKPIHKEIVDHIHSKGAMITKHSDGDNWRLLDDWIEVGFDGFHPVQPQCMDLRETKEHLSGKMSIWGNIDCRYLLVTGSPDEVRQTVKETIEIAAPGGGYIITSSNSIHPNVKAENYLAMVEAAHEYGGY